MGAGLEPCFYVLSVFKFGDRLVDVHRSRLSAGEGELVKGYRTIIATAIVAVVMAAVIVVIYYLAGDRAAMLLLGLVALMSGGMAGVMLVLSLLYRGWFRFLFRLIGVAALVCAVVFGIAWLEGGQFIVR